ncbi:thioredoxin reductase [Salinibacterium sp. CAN_S4]|uniref:NAD(P)/FAD-dependent oxidoreductase n=1 Tax=Salinibacterium sp. CAN_S4 TaxID=2787727 RepID=UPI0018EFF878
MEDRIWDVIIVGGGVAGLSAALMLGRARRQVLVVDGGSPRNRFASHMHGVLGNEGVEPAVLLERGRNEAASYGVEFERGTVSLVEQAEPFLQVALADRAVRTARSLIVATGLTDELADIPGLRERWGRTVLHCPYCHGWEVRDQRLGVIATSPMGLHQAELVRQWSSRVTLFTAGLGGISGTAKRRLRARGIDLVDTAVTEVLGEGAQIKAVRTENGREIELDAIFTGGALRPHDNFLAPLRLARAEGPMGAFVQVDAMGKTGNDRVWAAGNVVNPAANIAMAIGAGAAVGAGVNAALVAEDFDAAVAATSAVQLPQVSARFDVRTDHSRPA